jgi:hypothetical protein
MRHHQLGGGFHKALAAFDNLASLRGGRPVAAIIGSRVILVAIPANQPLGDCYGMGCAAKNSPIRGVAEISIVGSPTCALTAWPGVFATHNGIQLNSGVLRTWGNHIVLDGSRLC